MSSARLPAHWKLEPLGRLAKAFISGGTPATNQGAFWDSQVPWTTSAPIAEDDVTLDEGQRFITEAGLEGSASHLVPKGSLLVGTRVGVGKAVVNEIDMAISQDLTGVVIDSGRAVPEFLAYQFKSAEVQRYFEARRRGTTIKGVSRHDLERVELQLPPLPEQRVIARALRAVQEAKEARQRELALERECKAALMEFLFTHGTRGEPRKTTEAGQIPGSWSVGRLGEPKVAKIERGKFAHRPRNDPAFYGGSIPFIQTGDVTASGGRIRTYSQTLNEEGLSVSKLFPKGTIVITIAANIGFTAIVEFGSAFPDSLIAITPAAGVATEYLHYYLTTQQHEMDRKAPRGTQKNINIEFLSPWPVLLPDPDEQQEIAAALRSCDTKLRLKRSKKSWFFSMNSSAPCWKN